MYEIHITLSIVLKFEYSSNFVRLLGKIFCIVSREEENDESRIECVDRQKHKRNVQIMRFVRVLFGRNKNFSTRSCVVRELEVRDSLSSWQESGFRSTRSNTIRFPHCDVNIRFDVVPEDNERRGIVGFGLSQGGVQRGDEKLDGIPYWNVENEEKACEEIVHPNGAMYVDSIVLKSSDWRETDRALVEKGFVRRRVRDDVYAGITLVFYRADSGGPIIEVISPSKVASDAPPKPSYLWGLMFAVRDIDETHELLTPIGVSDIRNAVQKNRRIFTLKHPGVATSLAFISPHIPPE